MAHRAQWLLWAAALSSLVLLHSLHLVSSHPQSSQTPQKPYIRSRSRQFGTYVTSGSVTKRPRGPRSEPNGDTTGDDLDYEDPIFESGSRHHTRNNKSRFPASTEPIPTLRLTMPPLRHGRSDELSESYENYNGDDGQEESQNQVDQLDPNDFCSENYVDSAYFNGYDTILTRGDRLWYYYKDQHRLSRAFDQKKFTQGDHIQGAFNISRTPSCSPTPARRSSSSSTSSILSYAGSSPHRTVLTVDGRPPPASARYQYSPDDWPIPDNLPLQSDDCHEIRKMKGMAVYFLHNKDRARSYYNLDVRSSNGTQRRVRSRDLPWRMKQVGLLGGNLWPNGWESYQKYRPVAFLPARYELIFLQNHHHYSEDLPGSESRNETRLRSVRSWRRAVGGVGGGAGGQQRRRRTSTGALLSWNSLHTPNWNQSWRSRVLTHIDPMVIYTGMFEMNGVVYAIGERRPTPTSSENGQKDIEPHQRVGKMFRYSLTNDGNRDLREMDQSVRDFFGCPRLKPTINKPIGPRQSSSTSTSTTTTTTSTTTTTTTTTSSPLIQPTTEIDLVNIRVFNRKKLPFTTTSTTTTTTTTPTPTPTSGTLEESEESEEEVVMDSFEEDVDIDSDNRIDSPIGPNSDRSQLKSGSVLGGGPDVFLSGSGSNQIYSSSSVFLRNSKAKVLPILNATNGNQHHHGVYPEPPHMIGPGPHPGATLRESDSILLTVFIGIVISACIATIILAFLTITGRKKTAPRFEGARIERTIPKPTIIGLDYHPRKNSSTSTNLNLMSRYDSMNSINAIYSRISKNKNKLHHYQQQQRHHHHHHAPPPPPQCHTQQLQQHSPCSSSPESGPKCRRSVVPYTISTTGPGGLCGQQTSAKSLGSSHNNPFSSGHHPHHVSQQGPHHHHHHQQQQQHHHPHQYQHCNNNEIFN